MKRTVFAIFAVISLAIVFPSCQKAPFVSINGSQSITVTEHGESQSITFMANHDWTISVSESWCKVSPSSGMASDAPITISITCDDNRQPAPRNCSLTISAGDAKSTVAISQNAWIAAESVSFDGEIPMLKEGESVTLKVNISPANSSDQVIRWTSSNPAVASVENGVITAKRVGTAAIEISVGEATAGCTITVIGKTYSGLSFEALEDGEIVINNPLSRVFEYSKDQEKWIKSSDAVIRIGYHKSEVVSLRGDNQSYATFDEMTGTGSYTIIDCTSDCYIYGNINSLILSDNYDAYSAAAYDENSVKAIRHRDNAFNSLFSGNTHIKNHPSKPLQIYAVLYGKRAFYGMFENCTGLTEAPQLITRSDCHPNDYSFAYMFAGCINMKRAPELPFIALGNFTGVCLGMFKNCSSLVAAPVLPATKIGIMCYKGMFEGCKELTAAPKLPAAELKEQCYGGMFMHCDNLKTPPALPATILADSCYSGMFMNCINLEETPELPASRLANNCYAHMFSGCTNLRTAKAIKATETGVSSCSRMFAGCTSLKQSPDLLSEVIADNCYAHMFHGCKSLSYVKMMAIVLNSPHSLYSWLSNVSSNGTFVKNSKAQWAIEGASGIPTGWTIEYADN